MLCFKKKKIPVVALVCVVAGLMAGCATTPIPAYRAKPVPAERLYAFQDMRDDTTSAIVVTRDKGMLGSACSHLLTIDGTLAAKLDVGETAKFYVSPGEVFLRVGPEAQGICPDVPAFWTSQEVVLRPQQTKYYRLYPSKKRVNLERVE